MTVMRHWLEADELPRCQHCELPADERSFMCEDHAHEADTEVETLTEQLRGAVSECERLRVFERAFAKVPQEQQARIMDAVRADAAAGGQ